MVWAKYPLTECKIFKKVYGAQKKFGRLWPSIVFLQNIQLNVEVETLKKDLMDKTELMNQAA